MNYFFYYRENEGHDNGNTKTFRNVVTDKWYFENEMVEMFDKKTVDKLMK